jgi:hypothetical protein
MYLTQEADRLRGTQRERQVRNEHSGVCMAWLLLLCSHLLHKALLWPTQARYGKETLANVVQLSHVKTIQSRMVSLGLKIPSSSSHKGPNGSLTALKDSEDGIATL